MQEQMDLFEASYEKPNLPSKVRLIELFAGIGAQSKALEILGKEFESWRTVEWSWNSIIAYNAIHHKDFSDKSVGMTYDEVIKAITGISHDYNKPMTLKEIRLRGEAWARNVFSSMVVDHDLKPNISDIHASDLGIVERESYTYIMTYSFPCQDLSNAGLMKGMEKGSGTRSGLLWQVERILQECNKSHSLPQVLLMENVPGVCGKTNVKPWNSWLDSLQHLGYTNYSRIINAKDFGLPQNRKRCFMVSLLGNYSFSFPKKMKLRYVIKNFIRKNVDESYFLSDELVATYVSFRLGGSEEPNITRKELTQFQTFIHSNPKLFSDDHYKHETPTGDESLHIPSATKKGYMEAKEGDGVLPKWKGARGTVQGGDHTNNSYNTGICRGSGKK